MKTWKKVILIISSIVLGISLLVGGGYLYMKHKYQQEQEYMKEVVYSDEANKAFKKSLKNLDPKAFTKEGVIHSYQIDKSSIRHNPMGGIDVTLIINNDKTLYALPTINKFDNKLNVDNFDYSSKLYELTKEKK